MLTHRNVNVCKYKAIINNNHTKKPKPKKKKTSKKTNSRNILCTKQTRICIVLIQGNEKCLMKFAAVSAKLLQTVKCFPKILFNKDIVDLYLLLCFYILFNRWLESVTKVFVSEVYIEFHSL